MDEVMLRPAVRRDCAAIAGLYRISSDGVADYIWQKLASPGEDILAVGKRRYEREDTAFSYQNCHLAVRGDRVIGLLSAFPMHVDPAEVEEDPVLVPFAKLEEDNSFYVCGVAVLDEFRGGGIGSRLMALAEQLAIEKGYARLSLIVFEQNAGAKRLYDRLGFRTVAREPVVPHPLIHFTGDALLMVRNLQQ